MVTDTVVITMVMRSFKVVELAIPVRKDRIKKCVERIKKEFGDNLDISVRKGKVYIKTVNDSLSDHRTHDRILEILVGKMKR